MHLCFDRKPGRNEKERLGPPQMKFLGHLVGVTRQYT